MEFINQLQTCSERTVLKQSGSVRAFANLHSLQPLLH